MIYWRCEGVNMYISICICVHVCVSVCAGVCVCYVCVCEYRWGSREFPNGDKYVGDMVKVQILKSTPYSGFI